MIALTEALCKARNEFATANHLSETASNIGLRTIYRNKAEWLSQLIYAASQYQKLVDNNKYG